MSATDAGEAPNDPVGSLGEEFAKLIGALSGCLGEHRDEDSSAAGGGGAGSTSAECRFCPLCRTVHAVREVSPEVKDHLRNAGVSLLHAVSGMLAALTPDEHSNEEAGGRPRPSADVEHIDLDADDEEQ